MDSWARLACYPRGTFYPLSDGASTRNRRITKPCFRTCSTSRSRSQAPLCLCTRRLIANQPEGTFGRLRYSLGKLLARQFVSHARQNLVGHKCSHAPYGRGRNIDLQAVGLLSHCGLYTDVPADHVSEELHLRLGEALSVQV